MTKGSGIAVSALIAATASVLLLVPGQSVRITVTAVGSALFSTALLTVSPGGLSVPVTYQLLG